MLLKNVEITLGTILSNADPKHLGRCKVGIPGKFDRTLMSIEDLPWVFPFMMSKNQSYTTMAEGQKVWVIDNQDVPDEYWYIPFPEMNTDTKSIIGPDTDTDILISRNINGKLCQVFYNAEEGIQIILGNSFINVSAEGPVHLKVDDTFIKIDGGHVKMGADSEKVEDEMVRGKILEKMLQEYSQLWSQIAGAAGKDPHTALLAPMISHPNPKIDNLKKSTDAALDKLLSKTCKIYQNEE